MEIRCDFSFVVFAEVEDFFQQCDPGNGFLLHFFFVVVNFGAGAVWLLTEGVFFNQH